MDKYTHKHTQHQEKKNKTLVELNKLSCLYLNINKTTANKKVPLS